MSAQQLTQEQIADLKAVFERFDRNADGRISSRELTEFLKEFGQNPSKEQINEIVRSFDTNRNGQIEFEEFAQGVAKILLQPLTDTEIRQAFNQFAKGGSDKISARELKSAAYRMGLNMSDEDLEEMINLADIDGDGQVSFEEFCRIMK